MGRNLIIPVPEKNNSDHSKKHLVAMMEQITKSRFRYCEDSLFNKQIGIKPILSVKLL